MNERNTAEQPYFNQDDHWLTYTTKDVALEKIMTMYGEEIKRLIFTYTKNWAQTDDLTQDVFVSLYMKLDSFQGRSSLKSWIYSIAINKCKDYLKSWNYRQVKMADTILTVIKAKENSPDIQMELNDSNHELMKSVLCLPLKYREVIILFYYKEMSIEEISSLLKENQSTVKTRLKRAREKLKSAIKRGEWNE
ncbi:sigma-70 family RNA polymerase sigma factor [Bacillus timonensis]|nr:sigma-70 family RNA polymerase sigma factor [Bacillus timonensis]